MSDEIITPTEESDKNKFIVISSQKNKKDGSTRTVLSMDISGGSLFLVETERASGITESLVFVPSAHASNDEQIGERQKVLRASEKVVNQKK